MPSNYDGPIPARRGDLVIVQQHHRDSVLRGESREYDTYTVGTVTSITQDGRVKMFSEAGSVGEPQLRGQHHRGTGVTDRMQTFVLGSDKIDVPGALATAACRTWDTGAVRHASTRPYQTLAQAIEALNPHSKTEAGWMVLNRAATEHAATRRAAWVSCNRSGANYGMYETQLMAANAKYLTVYAQVTGRAVSGSDRPGNSIGTGREVIAARAEYGMLAPGGSLCWANAGPGLEASREGLAGADPARHWQPGREPATAAAEMEL